MNVCAGKGRPPRLDRLFGSVEPFYFVTFCTAVRNRLLANDRVHGVFRGFAMRGLSEHGVAVGRYVIMPDHMHLFVRLSPQIRLTTWGRLVKQTITKQCFGYPIWQRGFFDHVMRGRESYAQKWEYVRQNPVRAGLVRCADEWRFQGEITDLRF